MLVRFLRDVIIMVAALAALIAIAIRPAQDGEPRAASPSLDNRIVIPPAVAGADGLAMQSGVSTAAPAK